MSTINRTLLLSILLSFIFIPVDAQMRPVTEQDSLPLDSSIQSGRLDNGFTYFIKPLEGGHSKLKLHLYHKVGNNQEDADQPDIAHAVEHLAFKTTENFPGNIRNNKRIQSSAVGMFDYTAINGARGTIYSFEVPNEDLKALNLAFLWFKDIIDGLRLTDSDIDQVRGELSQEILLRVGDKLNDYLTESRLNSLIFPCNRDETNFFENNRTFKPEVLRRFYNDWNRPDLMAISVVGNIEDVEEMEKKIQEAFKDLPLPKTKRKLRDCDSKYYTRSPQFHIVERPVDTLKTLQNEEVLTHLYLRDPKSVETLYSMKGVKRLMKIQVLSSALHQRFKESFARYQPYSVTGGVSSISPSLEIKIRSEEGHAKRALKKVMKMLGQLKSYGITEEEWKQFKIAQLTSLSTRDTSNIRYWSNGIERFYLYEEAFPRNKHGELYQWLTELSLDEYNQFVQEFLSKLPEDIGIIAPPGSQALTFTEREVRSWIEEAYRQPKSPYRVPEVPSFIMSAQDIHGLKEVPYKELAIGPLGSKEIELENGVKVVFMNVETSGDISSQLKIRGFSLKGADYFPDEHYYSAINSPSIVRYSGVNGLNQLELKRFLATTDMMPGAVFSYINDQETGILGDTTLKDFELWLQLLYLYFTKPNRNPNASENLKKQARKSFLSPSYNLVHTDFNNAIMKATGEKPGSRTRGGTKSLGGTARYEGIQQVEFDDAFEIYQELFGNARDFTFIIRGVFDVESILPLVQKYIGNLPNKADRLTRTTSVEEQKVLPKGPLLLEIPPSEYYRMKNMMYGFSFIQTAENQFDWKEQLKVEALRRITSNEAWGLRFKKGYSLYEIREGSMFNREMNRYEVLLTLSCLPEEFDSIREDLKNIITEIKAGKISTLQFEEGLDGMYNKYSARMAMRPSFIDDKLYTHYRYGQPVVDAVEVESFVRSLTVEDIITTAKKIYSEENLFEFVMKN